MAMEAPEHLGSSSQAVNDFTNETASITEDALNWPEYLKGTHFQRKVSKIGDWFSPVVLLITDYLAIVSAILSSYYIRNLIVPKLFPKQTLITVDYDYLYFIIPLIYISLIFYERLYTKRLAIWQSAAKLFKISTFTIGITVGIMYFSGATKPIPQKFLILTWLLTFCFLLIARYLIKNIMVVCGLWQKPVIVVGSDKTIKILSKAFEEEPTKGYRIAGIIDNNYQLSLLHKYPVVGKYANAERAITASGVHDVIIAAPELGRKELYDLVYRIQPHVKNLTIIPDLSGIPMSNIEVETLFNKKILLLNIRNNLSRRYNRLFKYCFDVLFSLLGLLLISPLIILITILIYIESPGPVIFAHRRVGSKGKQFACYKFRTMVPNAQEMLEDYLSKNPIARKEWEQDFKLKNDPRITKIGKFLRKTSLDELPQLINVLKGEMSLVGPRPIVKQEIPKYKEYINDYYMVHPGLTGYWQVNGRNDIDYETRVQMDSWYVRNWSFWLDLTLLFKTVKVVFMRRGAY